MGPVASVCSPRDGGRGGGGRNREVCGEWKGGKKRVFLAACTRECFKLQLHMIHIGAVTLWMMGMGLLSCRVVQGTLGYGKGKDKDQR